MLGGFIPKASLPCGRPATFRERYLEPPPVKEYPTSIRISKKLKAELAKAAKAQRQRVSLLIVHILEVWVAERKEAAK
jgi:hypothetical protein